MRIYASEYLKTFLTFITIIMSEFIITFRESIEVVMIIGIIRWCLERRWYTNFKFTILLSIGYSLLASVVFAWILYVLKEYANLSGYDALFEGTVMIITSVLLLQMMHWIHRGSYSVMWLNQWWKKPWCVICPLTTDESAPKSRQTIKTILETLTQSVNIKNWSKGITLLVFFAVRREGVETVLMLFSAWTSNGLFSWWGFFWWIVVGCLAGYCIYGLEKRLPLKLFFTITSLILLLFAAYMMGSGLFELGEFMIDNYSFAEHNLFTSHYTKISAWTIVILVGLWIMYGNYLSSKSLVSPKSS